MYPKCLEEASWILDVSYTVVYGRHEGQQETYDSTLGKQLSLKVERSVNYIQIAIPCENAPPIIQ